MIPIKRSPRRDSLEIKLDILRVARRPILKTRLMYAVNISYTTLEKYLATLINQKLIEKLDSPSHPRGRRRNGRLRGLYITTEAGLSLLNILEKPIETLMGA